MTTHRITLGYAVPLLVALYLAFNFVVDSWNLASARYRVQIQAAELTRQATEHFEAARHPITTRTDAAELQRAYDTLASKVALPGESVRANSALNVAVVSVAHPSETFAELDLDIESLARAGVLIVADTPINWTIKGADAAHRAKIAFEGRAPVSATGMRQGLLAGLRIQGFGVSTAVGADSIDNERHRFCAAMAGWRKFFRLDAGSIEVWKVDAVDGTALVARDSGLAGAEHVGSLSGLCS